MPELSLEGGDLASEVIAANKDNPALSGISFRVLDILSLPNASDYDFVVANAVLCVFDPAEFERALAGIGRILKPGGHLVVFDWFHPYEQELAIVETTRAHPRGFKFHFRSYGTVRRVAEQSGFHEPSFSPFAVPIDLPKPTEPWDITSHTVKDASGKRLSFRGALCQPWCHMVARRR